MKERLGRGGRASDFACPGATLEVDHDVDEAVVVAVIDQ
jgi:hypothetical protein